MEILIHTLPRTPWAFQIAFLPSPGFTLIFALQEGWIATFQGAPWRKGQIRKGLRGYMPAVFKEGSTRKYFCHWAVLSHRATLRCKGDWVRMSLFWVATCPGKCCFFGRSGTWILEGKLASLPRDGRRVGEEEKLVKILWFPCWILKPSITVFLWAKDLERRWQFGHMVFTTSCRLRHPHRLSSHLDAPTFKAECLEMYSPTAFLPRRQRRLKYVSW